MIGTVKMMLSGACHRQKHHLQKCKSGGERKKLDTEYMML